MKTMNKSLNKNTKKEKEKEKESESDITLNKKSENILENKSDIDFSNFLHNYITNENESENESESGSGSDNSLISNDENDENDEGEGETNRLSLQNFCYSSDSSSDYLPRYSTLTLRAHNYIPPIYVGPIDIEVYRVIYSCLNSRFPEEICEIITDYLSSSVFV
jgi:hypothetical protein